MNRFMYHESILFTQPIVKIAKMNQFTVLESQGDPALVVTYAAAAILVGQVSAPRPCVRMPQ